MIEIAKCGVYAPSDQVASNLRVLVTEAENKCRYYIDEAKAQKKGQILQNNGAENNQILDGSATSPMNQ